MKTTFQKIAATLAVAILLVTTGCPEEEKVAVPNVGGVTGNIEEAKALVDKRASLSSAAATQIQTQVKTLPTTPVTQVIDKEAGVIVGLNGAAKPEDLLEAQARANLVLQGKLQEADAKYAAVISQGEQDKALLATKLKDAQDEARNVKAALELQGKLAQLDKTSTKLTNLGVFFIAIAVFGGAACLVLKIGGQGLFAAGLFGVAGVVSCIFGQLVTNEFFQTAVAIVAVLCLVGIIYGGVAIFMARRKAEAARQASLDHVDALKEENDLHKVALAKVVDTVETLLPNKSGKSVTESELKTALFGSLDQCHKDIISNIQVALKRKKTISTPVTAE